MNSPGFATNMQAQAATNRAIALGDIYQVGHIHGNQGGKISFEVGTVFGPGLLGKSLKSLGSAAKGLPRLKLLRESGGKINGFSISRGSGYGAKPRFDFHKLSNTYNSRATSRMTIPKWLNGKKLPHWHRGKGNNLRYHRPWEIGPDGKRRW